jgi:predicted ATPase
MADKSNENKQATSQNKETHKKELKENIVAKVKEIIEEVKIEIKCALIEGRVNYII